MTAYAIVLFVLMHFSLLQCSSLGLFGQAARAQTCHIDADVVTGQKESVSEFAAALRRMECWALFYGRVSPMEGRTPSFHDPSCSACSSRLTVILDVLLYPRYGTACWQL